MVFVDLETTGATATADRITEVGLVEIADDGFREWSTLVNPGVRISDFIERLTGISNAMVADAPRFADIAAELAERLAGKLFVAHNARFDYGFLKSEFARVGIDFRPEVLCTVKLSRRLFPQHHKHNLDSLISRHGIPVDARHRALGDARVIARFWTIAQREVDVETLRAAVAAQVARPSLPIHVDLAQLDALPEGPGVYLFHGENDLPLYVGKSKTVRKRVLAHFAGDHSSAREMRLAQEVRRVEAIATGGEVGALLLEAALIKRLSPLHNRQLRRNEDLCSWLIAPGRLAFAPPRLVAMADLPPCPEGELFGLFKSERDARRALLAIADDAGLCHVLLGLESQPAGRPCFSHQLHRCRGACAGKESPAAHAARVLAALAGIRLPAWPFPGAAGLREGDELHVFDAWRHLGTVRDEADFDVLPDVGAVAFDKDIYRIAVRQLGRMLPLPDRIAGAARRQAAQAML